MFTLYTLNESFTNGYKDIFIDIIAVIAVISGISVIISKNPIVSILFLIGLFLSVSSYLILLGMNFIGLSYLLVYIGAVSILFLFILMLINIRISELLSETNNSIPLAIIIGISFNYPVYQILPFSLTYNDFTFSLNNISNNYIYNNVSNYLNKIFNNSIDNNIYYATSKL
jgi:NADH-ubiquinone oxidoreductase chain 6